MNRIVGPSAASSTIRTTPVIDVSRALPSVPPPVSALISAASWVGEIRRTYGYASDAMRLYHVTTFGCQMNEHDSERMKGMLESLGYSEAPDREEADLILFNTCSIREKADN